MKSLHFFRCAALTACALWTFASCNNDDPIDVPPPDPIATPLEKPTITAAAEKGSNPIVLEFAWSAVENAAGYEYLLRTIGDAQKEVASGTADATTLEIAASNLAPIASDTQYEFSVRALPADAKTHSASEYAAAKVTTSTSAFRLSVSNVTYRSADMFCEPADEEMKYFLTQLERVKYDQYESDEQLYEEYEKGYFKAAAQGVGAPWYMFMEATSVHGTYGYHTGILAPETDYLLYAYGIKANVEKFDIELVTPIVKMPFRTPAWKATVDCSFGIEPKSMTQTHISFQVEPSVNNVTYTFGMIPVATVKKDYDNDLNAVARMMLYQSEALGGVHWDDPDALLQGNLLISYGPDELSGVQWGEPYYALAFGVDTEGLQTTEITAYEFVAPAEEAQPADRRVRELSAPRPPLRNADRAERFDPMLIF